MNAAKLNALLRKAPASRIELPELVAQRDPLAVMVFSFLLWEATTPLAAEAYRRLQESMVDFNDLRVSLPRDLAEIIGPRYPRCEERLRRMRASLNEIFKREHAVRFPVAGGKRDMRAYVESLEGMVVPFVAARVLQQCFGAHGIPVDEQTRGVLAAQQLCEPEIDLVELAGILARHVKSDHGEEAHAALQALVDQQQSPAPRGAVRGAAATGRRTVRRTKSSS